MEMKVFDMQEQEEDEEEALSDETVPEEQAQAEVTTADFMKMLSLNTNLSALDRILLAASLIFMCFYLWFLVKVYL